MESHATDSKYSGVGAPTTATAKILARSRNNNKRKKGKRKLDLRVDVVELDMIQDPVLGNLDRDAVEKIKSSRFPRLR